MVDGREKLFIEADLYILHVKFFLAYITTCVRQSIVPNLKTYIFINISWHCELEDLGFMPVKAAADL